jgi:LmbE family N-acetylglucosaminyl deacetylase
LLEPSLDLRREIVRQMRIYKPNAVVCADPILFYRGERPNHPDHRAAGRVVLDAAFPAVEMKLLYPEFIQEGITTHQINYVYIVTSNEPTYFIDVSSTIDTKIAALHEHKSQLGDRDYSERLKSRAADLGKQVGMRYAEAFRRLTIKVPE